MIPYVDWVEYELSKHEKQQVVDNEWYVKRQEWISRLRSIEIEAQRLGQEPEVQDQPFVVLL
jgi:hypothetical protein